MSRGNDSCWQKNKAWGKKLVHVVEETRAHLLSVQWAKNMQKK